MRVCVSIVARSRESILDLDVNVCMFVCVHAPHLGAPLRKCMFVLFVCAGAYPGFSEGGGPEIHQRS